MRDQEGMRALVAAVDALAIDPEPPEGFHRGDDYHRLKVGSYRLMYRVKGGVITVWHVDRT
jgi:mRNA-degrading endonuclease RelE of RelBE toxin-antitoxin system